VVPKADHYAFSKKKENLRSALALHFWFYDFARGPWQFESDSGDGSGFDRPHLELGRIYLNIKLT
jgi:hypothetical protein